MKENAFKMRAKLLRAKGYSFREISEILNISKSTAYLWAKDTRLSAKAIKRLNELGIKGRKNGVETNKKKRNLEDRIIIDNINQYFLDKYLFKFDPKIACALLYWCEGSKNKGNSSVSFTNADPEMINYFLSAFRKSFELDEKKFRGSIHLHEYHNPKKQLEYWSGITGIPKNQFIKPFLKKNTGINKKENYPGCLNIRYYDSKIYREIIFIIKHLVKLECGVS